MTRLCALLLLFFVVLPARAQDAADERARTEKRLAELQDQIARDEARLAETTEAEQATLETLQNLDRQIALREELLRNYRTRLRQLRQERDSLQQSLQTLETRLSDLRAGYRQRATHAYKYGRLHDLALILAAQSINQMLIRVRYLNRFTQDRRRHLDELRDATSSLEQRRVLLQEKVERNNELIREVELEQQKLARQKTQRARVVAELRRQRTRIESDLSQNRTLAGQLQSRIEELIAAETARRNRSDGASDADFARLSGSFRQNQGALPWPASGTVVEPFGDKVHPVYGTRTPNPGIVIATAPLAEVRAIFDGTVSSIDIMPDIGRYLIIEHGEYHTVYGNFALINVGEGQQVRAGQILGRAGTDAEPKGEGLFFGLFKDGKAIDPLPWLRPR